MQLYEMPAHALARLLAGREVTAVEVTESVLGQVSARESALGCYLRLDHEQALATAAEADRRRQAGETVSAISGIPMAMSDNICTRGLATTCASRMLESFVPPYDATVVSRLRQAAVPVVGKANLDEFGMGSSTENSAFGPTRHPWDTALTPGGACGGAAAAVASGEATMALGSDGGGSVRQPAAMCGLVGLRPTNGRVSRYGLVAATSSLEQIGPITRDVRDCALVMDLIAGPDPLDALSMKGDVPNYSKALGRGMDGMVVGLPQEYFTSSVAPEAKDRVLSAVRVLEGLGARIEEVSLPHAAYALATYYLLAAAECSSNLARYDGVRYGHRSSMAPDTVTMFGQSRGEGFGPEAKRRILLGTYVLSAGQYEAYYTKAVQVRALVQHDFTRAFATCGILATPTTPTVAFRLGERADDPCAMYRGDACTVAADLAGLPGITLPCGLSSGLPVGLQLIGPAFSEERLLAAAYAYQEAAPPAPLRSPKGVQQ